MAGPRYDAAILAELDSDPVSMGYAAAGWHTPGPDPMTEAEYQAVADICNDETQRDNPNPIMVAVDVFLNAIKANAWPKGDGAGGAVDAKAAADQSYLICLCTGNNGRVPLHRAEVRNRLTEAGAAVRIFDSNPTRSNIQALWAAKLSRMQELQIPKVRVGDLRRIRNDV